MLGDLDELVLRCRDERARRHIDEAVKAYKASAYRSAIIMTWIALSFDLVDKLRELSLQGDAGAVKKIEEYDRIHRDRNLAASLKFEKGLLECVRDEFELISGAEFIDLERIQDDRNRCAHPSINIDGEPFSPTPELARAHIRAAVEHVLQNEPAQGKHALERLMREINGEYFPRDQRKVSAALLHTPLHKGRKALVRAFLVIILKAVLRDDLDPAKRRKYINCLLFVKDHRPDIWAACWAPELVSITKSLDVAEHGVRLLKLECDITETWPALQNNITESLEIFVRELPGDSVEIVESIYLHAEPLRTACEARISVMTPAELSSVDWFYLPPPAWSHMVGGFCKSETFADANAWAKLLCKFQKGHELLSATDADSICEAVLYNRQVRECNQRDNVLQLIYDAGFRGTVWSHMIERAEIDEAFFAIPF